MKHKNSKGLSGKKKLVLQAFLALAVGVTLVSGKRVPTARVQQHLVEEHRIQYQSKKLDAKELMGTYFLPFKKGPLLRLRNGFLILGILFSVVVITGSSNAVNLTDGLDGLASGTLVMSAGVLALVAFLSNHIEISRYLNIFYIEESGKIR